MTEKKSKNKVDCREGQRKIQDLNFMSLEFGSLSLTHLIYWVRNQYVHIQWIFYHISEPKLLGSNKAISYPLHRPRKGGLSKIWTLWHEFRIISQLILFTGFEINLCLVSEFLSHIQAKAIGFQWSHNSHSPSTLKRQKYYPPSFKQCAN